MVVSVNSKTLVHLIASKAGVDTDTLAKVIGCKDAKSVYNKKLNNAFKLGELNALLKYCDYELLARDGSGECGPVPIDSPEAAPLLLSDFLKSVVLLNATLVLYDRRYGVYSTLDGIVKLASVRKVYKNVVLTTGSSTLIYTDRMTDSVVQLYVQSDIYFTLTVNADDSVVEIVDEQTARSMIRSFRERHPA